MTSEDPFSCLKGKPTVVDKILDYLGQKDLRNVHQVSRAWNEMVNSSHTWRVKLQTKVKSDVEWKEISGQLPDDLHKEADCPAKEKYATIFHAVQKLNKNWKSGCLQKRTVTLDVTTEYLDDTHRLISELITMNSKSLVVGFPSGLVKIFSRKNLKHKQDLFHGEGLQYVKFEGSYLITASFKTIHLWCKSTFQMMEAVRQVHSEKDGPMKTMELCCGAGMLIGWNDWGNLSEDGQTFQVFSRFTVWRLNSLNGNGKPIKDGPLLQMVHQELLPESNSLAIRLFVSEKYFVNVRQREIGPSQLCEVTIQVRSTFDFNIVYSIKDRLETLRCFSFNNDILAIQLFSPGKMISKIKIIDCNLKSLKEIVMRYTLPQDQLLMISSNSKYIVAANSTKRSAVVFDKEQVISTFKIPPASTLKNCQLNFDGYCARIDDFIVDELSVLQLKHWENFMTGQVTFQLVHYDFLELPPISTLLCCSNCEGTTPNLKRCGRCRKVAYCSVDCQKTDWKHHKVACVPSSTPY